jgi:hypothetical protein
VLTNCTASMSVQGRTLRTASGSTIRIRTP